MRLVPIMSIILAVAACSGATTTAPMLPQHGAAAEIEAISLVLDDLLAAAAAADESAYFAIFAADASIYGPDPEQRWDKGTFRDFARKHYLGKGWRAQVARREITLADDGRRAWFDEDLQTVNQGPMRAVGVATRDDEGEWRIVRYSFSLLVPEQRIQRVKALLTQAVPAATSSCSRSERPGGSLLTCVRGCARTAVCAGPLAARQADALGRKQSDTRRMLEATRRDAERELVDCVASCLDDTSDQHEARAVDKCLERADCVAFSACMNGL